MLLISFACDIRVAHLRVSRLRFLRWEAGPYTSELIRAGNCTRPRTRFDFNDSRVHVIRAGYADAGQYHLHTDLVNNTGHVHHVHGGVLHRRAHSTIGRRRVHPRPPAGPTQHRVSALRLLEQPHLEESEHDTTLSDVRHHERDLHFHFPLLNGVEWDLQIDHCPEEEERRR